jgi:hypothetical protein
MCKILVNMTQVSDVAPGSIVIKRTENIYIVDQLQKKKKEKWTSNNCWPSCTDNVKVKSLTEV